MHATLETVVVLAVVLKFEGRVWKSCELNR